MSTIDDILSKFSFQPLKDGEVTLDVIYDLPSDNMTVNMIRTTSQSADKLIKAIYIDNEPRKKPGKRISFSTSGYHVIRLVLNDSTTIPDELFRDADEMYAVKIPETIKKIGKWSFGNCHISTGIILNEGLETIESYAFNRSIRENIDEFILPDSLVHLAKGAFDGCSINRMIVGDNLTDCAITDASFDVIISPNNKHVVIKDNLWINLDENKVYGIVPHVFKDDTSSVIMVPNGIAAIDKRAFYFVERSQIVIPGSVKNVELESSNMSDECISIELKEGVRSFRYWASAIRLAYRKFTLPASLEELDLYNIRSVSLAVPSGATIKNMRNCHVERLDIMDNVSLMDRMTSDGCFDGFDGEIFFHGKFKFSRFGKVMSTTTLHVLDAEIGKKLFESDLFNQEAKILLPDGSSLMPGFSKWKSDLELLGAKDYPYTLSPIPENGRQPEMFYLYFNCDAKTTYSFCDDMFSEGMILDDGPVKPFRKKITIPKGQHILRLFKSCYIGLTIHVEPECEALLTDNSINGISELSGVNHLILGKRCDYHFISDIKAPYISAVDNHGIYKFTDGCLICRNGNKLAHVNPDVSKLPESFDGVIREAFRDNAEAEYLLPAGKK